MSNHNQSKKFLVGAALGAVLGSVSALLLAPKAGRKLREDICDVYCDVSEKSQNIADQVSKTSKSIAKNVSCTTSDLVDKAKCLVNGVTGWVEPKEEEDDMKGLLMGAIAGCAVGAVAAFLLAPKSGSELRQDLSDVSDMAQDEIVRLGKKGQKMVSNVSKKTNKWLELAEDVVGEITGKAQETGEDIFEKGKKLFNNSKINEVAEWASLGMRLWQHIQK
ncbi:MAG: YtxH domain-containing protein [Parachlamydiaceae bacterium]|nr:YtxH domain-containing protein [Parachlamydiaceae bacterium]